MRFSPSRIVRLVSLAVESVRIFIETLSESLVKCCPKVKWCPKISEITTKGCGSRNATLTMVFKLTKEAEKTWKKLRAFKLLPFVFAGEKFIDGEPVNEALKSAA